MTIMGLDLRGNGNQSSSYKYTGLSCSLINFFTQTHSQHGNYFTKTR